MTPAALLARGLSKRFGRAWALRDVDLEAPAGSCLAVLGPNGAGKSTLLRIAAGLARPSAGSLTVGELAAARRESRARIGFVGHETLLYPALTARENLLFAARLHGLGDAGERADAALAAAGLEALADRPAGALSRGQAQRVAIARGLVHDPDVVLLDEPFTGLDRPAAERLADRLADLHQGSRTVVLVTHEVSLAPRIADRAVVLAGGRVHYTTDAAPRDGPALEAAVAAASREAA